MVRNRSKIREQAKLRMRRKRRISANLTKYATENQFKNKCDKQKMSFGDNCSLEEKLRMWSHKHNITKMALNDLLHVLISFGLTMLPKDSRTLMLTPRNLEINDVANGKLWYNGVENNIRRLFHSLEEDLTLFLNFNIDGIPLFDSSRTEFWPILANVHGECPFQFYKYWRPQTVVILIGYEQIKPFVVQIWCGVGKPSNLNDYLVPFVEEMQRMNSNTIKINNFEIQIRIRCFICDTPARSFIKGLN